VAASKVASPGSAAISGAAGSTTSGSASGGALVVSGSAGQAMMTGAPWHVAVLIGALLVFLAGLLTALRGPDWPVMSSRYDAPTGQGARGGRRAAPRGRPTDAATMWESLNGGEDPTEDPAGDPAPAPSGGDQAVGRPGAARDAGAR
jgi:uncharacterized membrane protein (TIGR02234 family)